jgi:anti-sigma B factor antagonist
MALKTRVVDPDVTVVELSGHLNLGNSLMETERRLKQLIDRGARKLAVDLAALTYIDSAGIGMLVSTNGHIDHAGGRMRIAGATGSVANVFGVVHMEKIVALDADVATSIEKLATSAAAS